MRCSRGQCVTEKRWRATRPDGVAGRERRAAANASLVLKPYLDFAHRALASSGLALIAIQELRKLCLRRRIGPRMARARRQPTQLYPMQQPVGARQAAINRKLLLQYSLRVDRTKRHYPIPLQLGAGDNPLLEQRACHGVHPWLSTRARPVTQSLNAFLFVSGYAIRKPLTGSAQPAAPLPHAPSPRAGSRSSEPAGRPARSRLVSSAAAPPPPVRCEKSMLASPIPQTWYACLINLPHLGIPGSRYYSSR